MEDDARAVLARSCLGSVPEVVRDELLAEARHIELPAGRLVYEPEVAFVITGRLRAFIAGGFRQLTVAYLGPPQVIGIGTAAGRAFPVAFQALVPSSVVQLPRSRFDEVRRAHAQVGWAVAQELGRYLDDALAELSRVAFQSVRARTAHHLLALADHPTSAGHPLHQAEIAAGVGSVREVVGRVLVDFRRAGLIEMGDGGILGVEPASLRQVAAQDGTSSPTT